MLYLLLITAILSSCNGGGGGGGGEASSGSTEGSSGSSGSGHKYTDASADPLAQYLWHLDNTGQTNFSSTAAVAGNDVNLGDTHNTYRGAGQTVIVSDGRIDLDHPDLVDNTWLNYSKNYAISAAYNNPTSADDTDAHGTIVMGLIGAARGNGKGGYGIAPKSNLIGYNYLDSDQSVSKKNDQASYYGGIFNYSYGFSTCAVQSESQEYIEYLHYLISYDRDYITSSGNDYYKSSNSVCGGGGGAYLGNSNLDQIKSHPYYIVTSAMDAQGNPAEYSTPGSNVWIAAPGGEPYTKLPLIGTDLVGCTAGNAKSSSSNDFDKNTNGDNPDCAYATEGVEGTSFAAPTVTGAVALLREACGSSCNWREIKYSLAKTATKVNPSAGDTTHPLGYNLAGHTYQYGWKTNSAGFSFHNDYGFGRLDVESAINDVKNNLTNLGPAVYTFIESHDSYYKSGTVNIAIPDNSSTGAESTINVNHHNLMIEHVQAKVNITHTAATDLGIELESPSGMKSKLMNINNGIVGGNLNAVTFGSNAFLGEKTLGNWKLKVIDGANADTGTLVSWEINFLGSKGETVDTTAPEPVTNITNTGNTISWDHSVASDLKRYEACIKSSSSGLACRDHQWIPIGVNNSYTVSKYSIIGWFNIFSSSSYRISIRAVDENENVSTVEQYTWTAP